jgi:ferritin-like metal-binding protein YciE
LIIAVKTTALRNQHAAAVTIEPHLARLRHGRTTQPAIGTAMSSFHTLKDLLIDELQDLHSAETQLLKALPRLAEAAANVQLKDGFAKHLEETKTHVSRLDDALQRLGVTAPAKICQAMRGLVLEGSEAIAIEAPNAIRDANLIGAAQRVEHYEMAAYGTARAFAEKLGEKEIASLLQQTLEEESMANQTLTELAIPINDLACACGTTSL